jgi:hypothetical protein
MNTRKETYEEAQGQWRGFVQRSDRREPIAIDLEKVSDSWVGRLSAGDDDVPLENLAIISPNGGSFTLTRHSAARSWQPEFIFGP